MLLNWDQDLVHRAGVVDGDRSLLSPIVPGRGAIFGVDMNDRRQVVGNTITDGQHAYLWRLGRRPVDLGTLGTPSVAAAEINDAGSVIGTAWTADGRQRMFIWRHGTMTDLGTLGGTETGFLNPGLDRIGALNERDQVVGTSETASGAFHAFLWSRGRMRDLGTLGGATSFALDVNNRGEVVGLSSAPTGCSTRFSGGPAP